MDGYVRVSQVAGRSGERFQSPGQQRETIEGWAKAHGVRIAAWHEDLDRSGGTMDRPGMNAALKRIEDGQTGGIVCARLDRFARTVVGGLTVIAELDKRGARVVSVAESIDPATPMGRAMLGLLLIMGEWQRDQANEHLAAAQQRAASAGRFPGRPSYGHARTPDGLTYVNADTAPVLHRIFTARARGDGWRRIADDLTRDAVPSPTGRDRWTMTTIIGLVQSEAATGVFVGPRGLRVEDAWPAIVTLELWRAANAVHGTRDTSRQHQDRLLAGVARCAWCRNVLARTSNPEGFISYACRSIGCKERGSIGNALLDEHVAALIEKRLQRIAVEPAVLGEAEAERLEQATRAAVLELEAWRDDLTLRQALGEHDWREGLLARARARDDTETDAAEHRARSGISELPTDIAGVKLSDLSWERQRRMVTTLVHSVWLRRSPVRGPGARRHVAPRIRVVWQDDQEKPTLPSGAAGPLEPVRW